MPAATLTRMRLTNGQWEGLLRGALGHPPKLLLRHRDQLLGEPETAPAETKGDWLVRFRLPLDRLSDGVETFTIEDASTGEALAHETVILGDDAASELRAEVDQLRAELDMLKRAFRKHCAGSG